MFGVDNDIVVVVVLVVVLVVVVEVVLGNVVALLDFCFGIGICHLSAYKYCPRADTRPVALRG